MSGELENKLEDSGVEVRTYFVRGRNALLARAQFSELFVEYYLHLATVGVSPPQTADAYFKEALAAFILHCASRPRNETVAWTMNFQEPLFNLFLTANNVSGAVVGRVFCKNVRQSDQGVFFSEVSVPGKEIRRSMVPMKASGTFPSVEIFYSQSEQKAGRLFEIFPEDVVLLSAQPDCDLPWLQAVTAESLQTVDAREELALLDKRFYHWECGCTDLRILEVLAPTLHSGFEAVFAGQDSVCVECPRCSKKITLTREAAEAFLRL